jgi:hypothetical protein
MALVREGYNRREQESVLKTTDEDEILTPYKGERNGKIV